MEAIIFCCLFLLVGIVLIRKMISIKETQKSIFIIGLTRLLLFVLGVVVFALIFNRVISDPILDIGGSVLLCLLGVSIILEGKNIFKILTS